MLAGLVGRPLDSFPFMAAAVPLGDERSEGVRAGGVDVVCAWAKDGRSVASAPYEGIICDSWMVTLIKEAAFPERCGGGVGEEAWEASVCEREVCSAAPSETTRAERTVEERRGRQALNQWGRGNKNGGRKNGRGV